MYAVERPCCLDQLSLRLGIDDLLPSRNNPPSIAGLTSPSASIATRPPRPRSSPSGGSPPRGPFCITHFSVLNHTQPFSIHLSLFPQTSSLFRQTPFLLTLSTQTPLPKTLGAFWPSPGSPARARRRPFSPSGPAPFPMCPLSGRRPAPLGSSAAAFFAFGPHLCPSPPRAKTTNSRRGGAPHFRPLAISRLAPRLATHAARRRAARRPTPPSAPHHTHAPLIPRTHRRTRARTPHHHPRRPPHPRPTSSPLHTRRPLHCHSRSSARAARTKIDRRCPHAKPHRQPFFCRRHLHHHDHTAVCLLLRLLACCHRLDDRRRNACRRRRVIIVTAASAAAAATPPTADAAPRRRCSISRALAADARLTPSAAMSLPRAPVPAPSPPPRPLRPRALGAPLPPRPLRCRRRVLDAPACCPPPRRTCLTTAVRYGRSRAARPASSCAVRLLAALLWPTPSRRLRFRWERGRRLVRVSLPPLRD